ncbi:MAG: DUF4041 domain-containing protein [Phycisphaeraceae bacterium]|nr:MAG: DUF4041 domain-containing protein [Phycisphaeraceae bacterium]
MWVLEHKQAARLRVEIETVTAEGQKQIERLSASIRGLQSENARLEKWSDVADADEKAAELVRDAEAILQQAEKDAGVLLQNAEQQYQQMVQRAKDEALNDTRQSRERAKKLLEDAKSKLESAARRSDEILRKADRDAQEIAGEAYAAVQDANRFRQVAAAMKNIVEGYGDAYIVPSSSILDDLAEEFGYKEAGAELKIAREQAKHLVDTGLASRCDYAENNRRVAAERFVLDAFNGKVDSILARVKHDNFGTLSQEIRDAYAIVNHGGAPFRNARITKEYLDARLQELKWASAAQELRRQQQEEQRRLREQIREEAKARREYEKAIREAAKEEHMLRDAMLQAQAKIDAATAEQRIEFERQLEELNTKLREAEERNQRAISMAQQTKRGHVYIISNIGSFGENVYKIGLTRRLDPLDRVRELGDSSVPFDFDVHALIFSDDAPALEHQLHKHFVFNQVNKVNHRKEFFRADLGAIRREIEGMGVAVNWTMVAEAAQYRETLAIERAIADDPAACEAWRNKQLTLDPNDFMQAILAEDENDEAEADE